MSIPAQDKNPNCDWKQKPEYVCSLCDYRCTRKFLWNQHLETKKHRQRADNEKKQSPHRSPSSAYNAHKICNTISCVCGRTYKHVQSFNRHKKVCKGQNEESGKNELRCMVASLIRQNQAMLTENHDMREMLREMLPNIGSNNTTTINNRFNLQIFLNERCKDAINLSEFVETLELRLPDLAETRQNGYVSGISSIIVRGLKELETCRRPIHCSDLKREVIYVKDDDKWERENHDRAKMKQAISAVASKQLDKIKEWEASNPSWETTESGTRDYVELVKQATSSADDKSAGRIIKTIAREVLIEK